MQLTFEQLTDKIRGCWQGKNIGGVLGAPFEAKRGTFDVTFYTQDLSSGPPPNDDLDLQLVWLHAVEKFGRKVDSSILGDYWLSFITPDWVEYGSGKANMRAGMQPPLAGHVSNTYRNSCGCFIRSELWACLCPGQPELAVRYAYEDAIVDHAGDGMYAELFCAAIQSAAFVESDLNKLVDIGLSYIPADSGVAKAVRIAMDSYAEGVDFKEARHRIMRDVPGNFGIQLTPLRDISDEYEYGEPGYDAPSNIGLMLVGMLYGEGDFGKSLCIAVNCGEDTDCTAATLGALYGIMYGESKLPKEWVDPVAGIIVTCCINNTSGALTVPKNVDELSDRVLRAIPGFLGRDMCDILSEGTGYTVTTKDADQLMCSEYPEYIPYINGMWKPSGIAIEELAKMSPYTVKQDFSIFSASINYHDEPFISVGEPRKLTLNVWDNRLTAHQHWIDITLYTPDGVTIAQGKHFSMPLQNYYMYKAEVEFDVIVEQFTGPKVDIMIDISFAGRHTYGAMKATLYAGKAPKTN